MSRIVRLALVATGGACWMFGLIFGFVGGLTAGLDPEGQGQFAPLWILIGIVAGFLVTLVACIRLAFARAQT